MHDAKEINSPPYSRAGEPTILIIEDFERIQRTWIDTLRRNGINRKVGFHSSLNQADAKSYFDQYHRFIICIVADGSVPTTDELGYIKPGFTYPLIQYFRQTHYHFPRPIVAASADLAFNTQLIAAGCNYSVGDDKGALCPLLKEQVLRYLF